MKARIDDYDHHFSISLTAESWEEASVMLLIAKTGKKAKGIFAKRVWVGNHPVELRVDISKAKGVSQMIGEYLR
jgi:hypothetical protein